MKKFLIVFLFLLTLSCVKEKDKIEKMLSPIDNLKQGLENAYFEGQKDALNNDIRIEKINDSQYVWIKSPWDNEVKPIDSLLQ